MEKALLWTLWWEMSCRGGSDVLAILSAVFTTLCSCLWSTAGQDALNDAAVEVAEDLW